MQQSGIGQCMQEKHGRLHLLGHLTEGSDEGGSMNEKETLAYIEELKKYGSTPGLTNIRNLCEKLGHPERELSFVHIAGTNGKGSTLSFLSEILKCAGFKVGKYVSPTISDYRERIQINGRMISKRALAQGMTICREKCEELVTEGQLHPTAFEIETALAFRYFKEQKCKIVVLETGLGGEMDATNIVKNTLVEVFSSISLDHMGILGSSLAEISAVKAGIMKKGSIAVTTAQKPEVMEILRFRAQKEGIPLIEAAPTETGQIKSSLNGQIFSYKEFSRVQISLLGRYQIENAVLALEAIRALRTQTLQGHPIVIPDKAVLQGMKNATWPGRFQIVAKKPVFIADGAHNRDGAARLAESLRYYFPQKRMIFIMGILRDKEQEEIVKATVPLADQILTISTKGIRGFSALELAEICSRYTERVTATDGIQEALELAYLMASPEDVIVAFGSLSFLGELLPQVEQIAAQKAKKKGSLFNL